MRDALNRYNILIGIILEDQPMTETKDELIKIAKDKMSLETQEITRIIETRTTLILDLSPNIGIEKKKQGIGVGH